MGDGGGDLVGRAAVGGLEPFFGGAVHGPANGGGEEFGRDAVGTRMLAEAFEDERADHINNGGFGVGLQLASRSGDQVIAQAADDGFQCRFACPVKTDLTGREKFLKTFADHALQQGEFVWIMIVKGRAVDGGGFGDILHRDFFKLFGFKQMGQRLMQQVASAADARIKNHGTAFAHLFF